MRIPPKYAYRFPEIARLTGKSVRTIIRWFEREPGVGNSVPRQLIEHLADF